MKKYIFIPTGTDSWLRVAETLYNNKIAKPVFWLGDDYLYNDAKKIFGDVVFRKRDLVFYPELIEDSEYSGINSDFFISENYIIAKDRCLKMMDRLDIYGSFSRLDREAIFNLLTIWLLEKISEAKPEFLIFAETPHSHTYYLIYEICLYLDIKIAKFNTLPTVPVLFMQDMRTNERVVRKINFNKSLSNLIDSDLINTYEKIAKKSAYEFNYLKLQKDSKLIKNRIFHYLNSGLKFQMKEYFFQFRKNLSSNYYPINPYKLDLFTRERIKSRRKKNLKTTLIKTRDTDFNLSEFVYFSLSYEPERTTNPDGGIFHDQAIAISKLRSLLPEDIKIIVKEHPSQFLMEDRGSRGRSPIFYSFLKNIQGVSIADHKQDAQALIRESLFVATITGSAAVEAALLNKNSLIFGDVWFNECPNVYLWDKNLKYSTLMNTKPQEANIVIEYILEMKKKYGVPGFLNSSSHRRTPHYINNDFIDNEIKGIAHLITEYFNQCQS